MQSQHVAHAHEEGRCKAIAVNDAWRLAPWADLLYACDLRWWQAKRPPGDAQAPSRGVTQDEEAADRYGLVWTPSRSAAGLCRTPWVLHQGQNSGYQALNLAYHLGAARVLLLGYDMQRTGGKSHWFGDHPPGLQVPSPYDQFIRHFDTMAADLQNEGVEVLNCSPQTALQVFPRASIFDIL